MKALTSICLALAAAAAVALASIPAYPSAPAAAAVHPQVFADLSRASDGQATFFVLLADQADLAPAAEIRDWAARGQWVFDALTAAAQRSQEPVLQTLRRAEQIGQVSQWQPYWIVNTVAVRGNRDAVERLARAPSVAQILPEIRLEAPDVQMEITSSATETIGWNIEKINADDVWAMGYTGEGMVVANLDTGVDYTHPALITKYRGNQSGNPGGPFDHNYNWFDPFWHTISPRPLPVSAGGGSPHPHGTHVMGTEVGSAGADEIGVAPGARWIATYGCCPDNATLLSALQWHLAPTRLNGSNPNPAMRAHVLQNSWGGPGGSQIFDQAMTALKASGMFVSASAGNSGPACGTLGSPGDNDAVFNVGGTSSDDGMYINSSRGPNPFSGEAGPDVVAPGVSVRSSVPGGYQAWTGTSMAGPHIAGAVALLWDANPDLIGQVDFTAELLRKTATPLLAPSESCGGPGNGTQHPNNTAGWGQIDVQRAVELAGTGQSKVVLMLRDGQGQPLSNATAILRRTVAGFGEVELVGTSNSAGEIEFFVSPGPASLTASSYGYAQSAATAITVGNGTTNVTIRLQSLPLVTLRGRVLERAPFRSFLPAITAGAGSRGAGPAGAPASRAANGFKALDARVSLPDTPLGPVSTDCNGEFTAVVPTGVHSLLVEATGYAPREVSVNAVAGADYWLFLDPAHDYAVADSRTGGVPYQWIDARSGTRYSLGDDDARAVALPGGASMEFYDNPYSSFNIGSNGFLSFGQAYTRFHGIIPFEGAPNNAIYAFAEDLNPAAGTPGNDNGIYVRTVGSKTVVQYNQVEHWASGDPETFQVILDTASDQITLQYQQVSWPDFTTVGVENATGDRGIPWSYANSGNLAPGLAVRFTPVYGQAGVSCQ